MIRLNYQADLHSKGAMRARGSIDGTLTYTATKQAIFLTLTMLLILSSRFSLADSPVQSQTQIDANKQQAIAVENYIRTQIFQGVSILPSEAQGAISWFSGNAHPVSIMDDDEASDQRSDNGGKMGDSANKNSLAPDGLSSSYHHKGFLPTHDAMVLGIGAGQNLFNDKLSLSARPFYGQSWHSLHSYWGSEVAMNIANKPDGMPWGKLALGYVQGNDAMTDHGQGIEMHGDVDLTSGFKLTSGIRQNSADGNSNYLMVRWKMDFE